MEYLIEEQMEAEKRIPKNVKFLKFEKLSEEMKKKVDLIVVAVSSKGIEWVSNELSKVLKSNIPILFGILTTDTLQQALERAGTKALNKGWELMESTLQSISIYAQIKKYKK